MMEGVSPVGNPPRDAKVGLLFPGQGAQYVGMGRDLADTFPVAREVWNRADAILDFPLSRVCFDGPEHELNRTDVCQPAILAHSWAAWAVLQSEPAGRHLLDHAAACAGLSLGEYSAFAASGALTWEDALRLVRARGRYMQEACDAAPSTMASILGLDDAKVEDVCRRASEKGVCVAANFNSPGQVVIAGTKEAVEEACELAKAEGAKRCIPLTVAGAFHSPLMEPAREKLAAEVDGVRFSDPKVPVVANVTAKPVNTSGEAKRLLIEQLTSPVRWAAAMKLLVDDNFSEFAEIGPGNVLAGLLKKIARDQPKLSLGSSESIKAFLAG